MSVIVPLYGVERMMSECVESVLAQTYAHIEVILVDDGSPDRSGELAEGYRARDARVRVIHQPNRGLSAARNAGTQAAAGEYVTYVDGDDVVDERYVEYLLALADEHDARASVCPMRRFSGSRGTSCEAEGGGTLRMGREDALRQMLYQKLFDTSACGKLFLRQDALAVPFPEGRLYEDLDTVYRLLWRAGAVAYGPRVCYFYRVRRESITGSRFDARRFDEVDAVDRLCAFVDEQCPALRQAARSRRFSCYCQVFLAMPEGTETYSAAERNVWDGIRSLRRGVLLDGNARVKNRCAALLALLGRRMFRAAGLLYR